MRYKTLKHKTIDSTYGIVDRGEIHMGDVPDLQPLTATMEAVIKWFTTIEQYLVVEQLKDYDLVEVEVNVVNNGDTREQTSGSSS